MFPSLCVCEWPNRHGSFPNIARRVFRRVFLLAVKFFCFFSAFPWFASCFGRAIVSCGVSVCGLPRSHCPPPHECVCLFFGISY
jgi:hypothetical protein